MLSASFGLIQNEGCSRKNMGVFDGSFIIPPLSMRFNYCLGPPPIRSNYQPTPPPTYLIITHFSGELSFKGLEEFFPHSSLYLNPKNLRDPI